MYTTIMQYCLHICYLQCCILPAVILLALFLLSAWILSAVVFVVGSDVYYQPVYCCQFGFYQQYCLILAVMYTTSLYAAVNMDFISSTV